MLPQNYAFDLGLQLLGRNSMSMQSPGSILMLRPWDTILLSVLPLLWHFLLLPRQFCVRGRHTCQSTLRWQTLAQISHLQLPFYTFGTKIGNTTVPGARIPLGSNALDPDSDDGSVEETAEADIIEITSDSDQEPGQSPFLIVVWTMVCSLSSQIKSTDTSFYLGEFFRDGSSTLLHWRQPFLPQDT